MVFLETPYELYGAGQFPRPRARVRLCWWLSAAPWSLDLLVCYRPLGSKKTTTLTHLRRFFDDACFFFFSPANLCRGFSSTSSSSSS